MPAKLFGLAEIDAETGEADPEAVHIWGMETDDGTIMYWRDCDGRNQFAVFDSAEKAARRFGPIFDLTLYRPGTPNSERT